MSALHAESHGFDSLIAHMNETLIDKSVWGQALLKITEHPTFKLALEVAVLNSKDKHIYLAGGKLYRSIIEELYGYPARAECCDYDFVTKQTIKDVELPKDLGLRPWETSLRPSDYSYSGAPGEYQVDSPSLKFFGKGVKVDIISLGSLPYILEKNLPRTIESYFDSVPLDIQAIAVDLDVANRNVTLIGARGQQAILNKRILINNVSTLEKHCGIKGISQNSFVGKKAKSVRFAWG